MRQFKLMFAMLAIAGLSIAAENTPSTTTATTATGNVTSAPNTTVTTTTSAPSAAGIIGGVDLRPTYKSTVGSFATEDYGQVGYRFNGGNTVTYRQEFMTNLYEPSLSPGLNAQIGDGSLRLKLNNLMSSRATGLSFHLEPRLYVPTNAVKRDNGFITAARTYVKLKQNFSPTTYFQVQDSPILHVYSKDGNTVAGKLVQNPDVENRFLVEFETQLFLTGLTLYVPLELQSAHLRGFGGKEGTWSHRVTFWPEITYPVASTVRLGVAFRSDNMVKADLSGTNLDQAFRNGVTQMVFNASL